MMHTEIDDQRDAVETKTRDADVAEQPTENHKAQERADAPLTQAKQVAARRLYTRKAYVDECDEDMFNNMPV